MRHRSESGFEIDIVDDTLFSIDSADNVHTYDHVYKLDENLNESLITSRHAINLYVNGDLLVNCILLANGGGTTIHEHAALVLEQSIYIAAGPYIASLKVPSLSLQWKTMTDATTCFGIYFSEKHNCLISHGELEFASLKLDGNLIWQAGGPDIFTNRPTIEQYVIRARDFNDQEFVFDIATGQLVDR